MAKESLYEVRQGYSVLGVGTITQCQAVQKALDKLKPVNLEQVIGKDGESEYVLAESDFDHAEITVGKCRNDRIWTQAEVAKGQQRKLTMQPKIAR